MVDQAGVDVEAFSKLLEEIHQIKSDLTGLIYIPSTLELLRVSGFATNFNGSEMQFALSQATNQAARNEVLKSAIASNIVGLYEGLREWYFRVGEGRVEVIKAVIDAERAVRKVDGVIIFDTARRIDWKADLAVPGYQRLGGLYAQLLGDKRFVPYAVLSSEQYLPYDEHNPLPPKISAFVEKELMQGEIAKAMSDLVFQGLDILTEKHESLV